MEDTSLSNIGNSQSEHAHRLEEIDKQQRADETMHAVGDDVEAFAKPVVEALNPNKERLRTPLLEQEEIEDEEPPRVNWTAVVCTAIVCVCATVILCVSQPWKGGDDAEPPVAEVADSVEAIAAEETPAQAENVSVQLQPAEQSKPVEQKTVVVKESERTVEAMPAANTLPVVRVTTTGTDNPYNKMRLVDASSRMLTEAEVAQMSKEELALARNAIYARHGYQFNNAQLREFFSMQSWFKASDVKIDAIPFTKIELDNIRLIKSREQNL